MVARATGAAAMSITRSGCPFSKARVVVSSREQEASCRRWNRDVLAWLGKNPEISTIFLSQRAKVASIVANAQS